jgi:hypothetical protein
VYTKSRNIVIGFHGCDKSVRDSVVAGQSFMKRSSNDYDWLGGGFYFWENNLQRAMIFAQEKHERQPAKIKEPAVLGAFIDLGYCLDLLETSYLLSLKGAYTFLKEQYEKQGLPMPVNKSASTGYSFDLMVRKLDCAVIESIHLVNKKYNDPMFDSVRGVFWEGEELYPNAGFREKNHIQICVRNPNCIKGFFIPRDIDLSYLNP